METGGDNKKIGERDLHQTSELEEQGNGSLNNSHLEEVHPSSSSPSQNPFLVPSDASENTGNECINNVASSTNLADSTHHSSPENLFQEPTTPISTEESSQNQPPAEAGEDDVPNSSMPKHEHGDVAVEGNQGPEIQNPPVQVMERPGESENSPQYVFPSHVFSKSNANSGVEWSTASNESLFSIYMGNTSFSSELACLKSYEMDKPGDLCMYDQPNASANHQPDAPDQNNKFHHISQRTYEEKLLQEISSKATEAKAAETMREVIMESSQTTENFGNGNDNSSNSHHHDDSVCSYAFQMSKGRDISITSKGAGDKQNEQKQTGENETPNAADHAPKSSKNTPNKWLACFSCCTCFN